MPPRNLPRCPFAGTGAGKSVVAGLARGSSASPGPSLGLTISGAHDSPGRFDGLPSADALSHTLSAFPETDFTSSGVSDSLTRAFYFDVIFEQVASTFASSSSFSKSSVRSAFSTWLGEAAHTYGSETIADFDSCADTQAVPRSSSGSSITAVTTLSAASPLPSSALNTKKIDPSRFFGRVQELIDTERSYVNRIDVLHQKYAVPLRTLAKDRQTAIIPLYEAQRLFGNIGEIAGANRAFLMDLERLASQGQDSLRAGLGDVLYNHMSCFSCYTEYFANFEKAKHIERTLAKHRAFCEFADRTKYSITGIGNTGLRDLLMEPIQRIPRYKLLIDAILAHVEPRDPLRIRLDQVVSLVSRIANCEADEKTQRAAVLWSLSRNVEAFPAELISVHRRFIDCIDVDDFPLDSGAASSGITASFAGTKPIPCTLLLFDDRLAIVKRAHSSTNARKILGFDDVSRLATQMKTVTEKSSHTPLATTKRHELSFRGSIGLMDIHAQDLGGTDLQLAFLRPPSHVTGEKWTSRPLRQYVAVDTSAAAMSTQTSRMPTGSKSFEADVSAKLEKMRFLDSAWSAKAIYKASRSLCETRCKVIPASRRRVDSSDGLLGATQSGVDLQDARKVIYFHVHSRQSYAAEAYRTAVALSVDEDGSQSRTPLGGSGDLHPHALLDISQVDEMEEEFVAQVRTKAVHDNEVLGEAHLLSSADLGEHLVQLSDEVDKRFGDVIRTYCQSQPGTPSGSGFRQRAKAVAGLENFGRSLLFGASGAASSISSAGISSLDVFGSPARRSNSNASKSTFSSTSASISSRGVTMSTAGTSVSSRSGALEALSRGAADSPRSLRRFGRRRSSSVGPPSSAASRCRVDSADEDDDRLHRRARAATPDSVSLLSTSAGASTTLLPRKVGAGSLVASRAGGGHVRAKTESAAPTAPSWSPSKAQPPYQQRQRAESVDLCRTPSSAGRRPTGPREQASPSPAPRPDAGVELQSPSWLSSGPTTPLNIRRKPVPGASHSSDDGTADNVATPVRARPASSIGVYGAPNVDGRSDRSTTANQRRVSGTKRPLSSSFSNTPEAARDGSFSKRPTLSHGNVNDRENHHAALLPRSVPLSRLLTEEPTERPSMSESETPTERGREDNSNKPAAEVATPTRAPVTPARTSSTTTKSQEARRRNGAMEQGLRLVKEEMNLLRCDIEILQSGIDAMGTNAQTPRKRRGDDSVLKELDLNATASISAEVNTMYARIKNLEFLFKDVDAKWISSIRMHNRIMHDLNNATSALAASQTSESSCVGQGAEAQALLLKQEKETLEIQVSALKRKCDLLTTLEADGRLENTEIHKAFNEELDLLYEHTQTPASEELAFLRNELKRTKADQYQLMVENKRLKRDLSIEQSQAQTYKEALAKHGLL